MEDCLEVVHTHKAVAFLVEVFEGASTEANVSLGQDVFHSSILLQCLFGQNLKNINKKRGNFCINSTAIERSQVAIKINELISFNRLESALKYHQIRKSHLASMNEAIRFTNQLNAQAEEIRLRLQNAEKKREIFKRVHEEELERNKQFDKLMLEQMQLETESKAEDQKSRRKSGETQQFIPTDQQGERPKLKEKNSI